MKIIIAVTGASGSVYAQDLLERLIVNPEVLQIAVIRSTNAEQVWSHELDMPWPEADKLKYFSKTDFTAPFASGSSAWNAMVLVPASMGTVGRIAHGISDELISRTADVMLKEERQLIVCPRELPFNQIHLKNLLALKEAGATIMATSPSFYSKPLTIKDLIGTVTSRIVDHLGLKQDIYRWGEQE
jgi:4-hydroxy-3-polyprenylbenzoate decarboxylase